MQDWSVDWFDLQFDVVGVVEFFGQWNVLLVEFWYVYVYCVEIWCGVLLGVEQIGGGFEGCGCFVVCFEYVVDYVMYVVVVCVGFGVVIVVDVDEGFGVGEFWFLQYYELVVGYVVLC